MQSAKTAAATVKETAANMAASGKSGMEKTKAIMQEKGERMTAHDPLQKKMATEKKEHRINQAELNKQEVHEHNAANKQATAAQGTGTGTHSYSAPGVTGHSTGMHQMSAMPGEPAGQVTEGTNTGTGTTTAGHNTRVGGGTNTGYGTGAGFR